MRDRGKEDRESYPRVPRASKDLAEMQIPIQHSERAQDSAFLTSSQGVTEAAGL